MGSLFRFSIQQFFIYLFYCQNIAFVCEFQHTPCRKSFFSQYSTFLVDMRLCKHLPNSLRNKSMEHLPNLLRNKSMERHIPYLLKKMVFEPSKL
jgi:hypothetical protein